MNIRLEQVTKRFGAVTAVDALSLAVQDGELVCLLGPSGCGKSTTLSMIAGLETPTAGEIYFDEQPMQAIEAEARDIGMVFQNYALYPHMSVAENILFPLKMRHVPKRQQLERMQATAELLQIQALLQRKPSQLSGGQQQRVAIARAVVKEPRLLLLDEPFSNLDARLRIELRNDIRALQKRLGITTIFVTHDQEEAMSISDRILLLHAGVLQQFASPEEMYRQPKNQFTAGFLGNPPMNFLRCHSMDGLLHLAGGWTLPLHRMATSGSAAPCLVENSPTQHLVLGVRPEDLEAVEQDESDFVGEITAVQTLGKEVYLRVCIGTESLGVCLRWDRSYTLGQPLPLRVRWFHLFPEEKGASDNEAK